MDTAAEPPPAALAGFQTLLTISKGALTPRHLTEKPMDDVPVTKGVTHSDADLRPSRPKNVLAPGSSPIEPADEILRRKVMTSAAAVAHDDGTSFEKTSRPAPRQPSHSPHPG